MRQDKKKKVTNNGFQFYRDPLNDSYSLQLGADKKGKETKIKKESYADGNCNGRKRTKITNRIYDKLSSRILRLEKISAV